MNATHEVFNQPNALVGHNLFTGDHALQDALRFNASALATEELSRLGATLGTAEMQTTWGAVSRTQPICSPDNFFAGALKAA